MKAWLFPGQGSQYAGMLQDDPRWESSPAAQKIVDSAQHILGEMAGAPPFTQLDSPEMLTDQRWAQFSLALKEITVSAALREAHVQPDIVAGHSVGTIAAAYAAGVLTAHEALEVIAARGSAMAATSATGNWGMLAVEGLSPAQVAATLEANAVPRQSVWIAVINSASQVVCAGKSEALTKVEQPMLTAGAYRVKRLPGNAAAHGPVQQEASQAVAKILSGLPSRELVCPYMTCSGGRRVFTAAQVHKDLVQSITMPVQWATIMGVLPELGVNYALELPPGHVLTHIEDGSWVYSLDDDGFHQGVTRWKRSP